MRELQVWKFRIPIEDDFLIEMPSGSKPLHVGVQADQPFLWALTDPKQPASKFQFKLCGTGHPRDDLFGFEHIGTFMLHDGALVFHLFGPDYGSLDR